MPDPGRAWYVTFVLTLCYTIAFVDSKLPLILVQSIKADLGLTDTQIGLITGPAFSLTYALAVIPIARLSDLFTRKYAISAAIAVWSLFTAAGGLVHSFLPLLLSRTGVAIGESGLTPAAHSIIADIFPERLRPRALAVYFCGIAFGTFLALFAGGWINDRYGWRAAMFAVGASGVICLLLMLFTVGEPARIVDRNAAGAGLRKATIATMFTDPVIRHTIVGGTLVCVAFGGSIWFPAYMIRTFHLASGQVGATYGSITGSVTLAGALLGGVVTSALSKNDPRRGPRFLALMFAAAAAFDTIAFLLGSYAAFLVFASAATLLLLFYPGPTYALIQSRVDSGSRSFASAVTLFCLQGFGIAFGAFLTGWLSDRLIPNSPAMSLRWALLIVSMASFWGALHYFLASRHLAPTRAAA